MVGGSLVSALQRPITIHYTIPRGYRTRYRPLLDLKELSTYVCLVPVLVLYLTIEKQ
jgi:hypothetical protein